MHHRKNNHPWRSLLLSLWCKYFLLGRVRSFCSYSTSLLRLLHTVAPKSVLKMSTLYEKSIARLNGLQNNAATVRKSLNQRDRTSNVNHDLTKWCLEKCNIKLEEIDRLNVIHVSGTKGKGSTCAFTESILRQFGFKTGFYSSPHLVHVRERIRINGDPLSEEDFVKYFEHIYSFLEKAVEKLALVVSMTAPILFSKNPVVCGVTTLDYDHMPLLGSTIELIAWHKAGIFKSGGIAVVSEQPDGAMKVLKERATSKNCLMQIAPPFNAYTWPVNKVEYGIPGIHQQLNITLAFQLVKLWLEKFSANLFKHVENIQVSNSEVLPGFVVPQEFLDGIRLCQWLGRSQIIERGSVTYYLDGAHTPKSLEVGTFASCCIEFEICREFMSDMGNSAFHWVLTQKQEWETWNSALKSSILLLLFTHFLFQCCMKWFLDENQRARRSWKYDPFMIMLFHCTGSRDPSMFLLELSKYDFKLALFCPPRLNSVTDQHSHHANYTCSSYEDLVRVADHASIWRSFGYADTTAEEFDCVQKAIERIEKLGVVKNEVIVLVTGSLHLVGSVLAALDFKV
uniref:tetrahydrofolate synthase n=1 Tax=Wuchereria bancrofti TaxID=6293 RepID=A0A1I8ED53_WUCBA